MKMVKCSLIILAILIVVCKAQNGAPQPTSQAENNATNPTTQSLDNSTKPTPQTGDAAAAGTISEDEAEKNNTQLAPKSLDNSTKSVPEPETNPAENESQEEGDKNATQPVHQAENSTGSTSAPPAEIEELLEPVRSEEGLTVPAPKGLKIYTKVLGKSGKIKVSSDVSFSQEKTVVIELDSISELGEETNGDLTALSGPRSTFNTFANQDFEISDVSEVTYPSTNLSAFSFSFTSALSKRVNGENMPIANVRLTTYIFSDSGKLNISGEISTVDPGSVKFNIELNGYSFCEVWTTGCSLRGKAVDVVIAVKGLGKTEKAPKLPGEDTDVFSLGGSAALKMSRKVKVDGQWTDMAEGFPKLEEAGAKQLLRCRFPRFLSEALYDPTVDLGEEAVEPTTAVATNDGTAETDANAAPESLNNSTKPAPELETNPAENESQDESEPTTAVANNDGSAEIMAVESEGDSTNVPGTNDSDTSDDATTNGVGSDDAATNGVGSDDTGPDVAPDDTATIANESNLRGAIEADGSNQLQASLIVVFLTLLTAAMATYL